MSRILYLFAVILLERFVPMKQHIVLPRKSFLVSIAELECLNEPQEVRKRIQAIRNRINRLPQSRLHNRGDHQISVAREYLDAELAQIAQAHTVERARYYLSRLRKALTSEKNGTMNDLNLRRWKEYEDIWTDSLWIVSRRDASSGHAAWYWGNFIPQIPHQLLMRYTKKGEWVLDPFAGSGTTLLECLRLHRNGLGVELNSVIAARAATHLSSRNNGSVGSAVLECGDSVRSNFRSLLRKNGQKSVQLVILHPPYHDIIRFSKDSSDLSNAPTIKRFLQLLGRVVDNSLEVLDRGRMLALVIGDKYTKREWVPMGFLAMNEVLKRKCLLKSIVVKNFEQTVGKRRQEALWRYRALAGGFYVFKHEYIFVFQKN